MTGAGSFWDASSGVIYVSGSGDTSASGGAGALHILSGGQVKATLLKVFQPAFVEIDNGSTSVPGLIASGDEPAHAAGGSFGDIAIGNTGTGRMEIRSGGAVANRRGFIGGNAGSEGAVLVTGSGAQVSDWQNTRLGLGRQFGQRDARSARRRLRQQRWEWLHRL